MTEAKAARYLFRFLLTVMCVNYYVAICMHIPGDSFDWLHWAVASVATPTVLGMGWGYSK